MFTSHQFKDARKLVVTWQDESASNMEMCHAVAQRVVEVVREPATHQLQVTRMV